MTETVMGSLTGGERVRARLAWCAGTALYDAAYEVDGEAGEIE